jgi:hypothetical protein
LTASTGADISIVVTGALPILLDAISTVVSTISRAVGRFVTFEQEYFTAGITKELNFVAPITKSVNVVATITNPLNVVATITREINPVTAITREITLESAIL